MPPGEIGYSLVGIDVGEEVAESCQEDRCHESVVFHRVVGGNELVGVEAEIVAISAGVAEGNAGKVDVAVAVSSDQVEEISTAAALLAELACTSAAGLRVAGEEFDEEGGYFEEGVEEGTSDDAVSYTHLTLPTIYSV